MRRRTGAVSAGIIALAVNATLWSAPFPDPTPRKEAILKLFVKEFVPLTPGKGKFPASFQMGSKTSKNEQPVHKVSFNYPFAIAKYEVTQELYYVIMGDNPARWKGSRNSVEMIDWFDAVTFCRKATKELRKRKLLKPNEEIRLPSEAEWEYACRAGTSTSYYFGDKVEQLTHYSWYKKNAPGNDPPVGKKKPNAWGLYDMHGYVSEWCADAWHDNYRGAPDDGSVWKGDTKLRVIRGGSFADPANEHRSAFRKAVPATLENDRIGFRCVKAIVAK